MEMKPEIIPIDENTWIFEEGGVRFFLLTGKDKALLIDSGMQTHNAKELARELTDLPLELLNTHADPDHIGSNHEFESFYMNPAEATNYYKTQNRDGEIIPVWDNDVIDLGERPLRIIETPGHTPGSIAVLDEKKRRLFSGDPVQTGHIFMFGPQRELHAYGHSLKKIKDYSDQYDTIYPSHAAFPVTADLIDPLYDASQQILRDELVPEKAQMFGMPVLDYDAGVAHFLCDAKEAFK